MNRFFLLMLLGMAASEVGCSSDTSESPGRSKEDAGSTSQPDGSGSQAESGGPRPEGGGTQPDAAWQPDSGNMHPDVGAPQSDGASRPDTGTPQPDAGATSPDGGGSSPDGAGMQPDSSTPPTDSGAPRPDAAPDSVTMPPVDGGTRDAAPPSDGGVADGGAPGTSRVFDQIPQFGIYNTTDPIYTPPSGVVMWSHGTVFLTKLTPPQQSQIGADLKARVTYHAQCDNYDRLGGLFFIVLAKGQTPTPTDDRIELARFITPFSDYMRGALATYVFPIADVSTFARTLADPSRDVWVGIAGGSNPYTGAGDPCPSVAADFKAVGFKYSLDLVSTQPLSAGSSMILNALYYVSATSVPVTGTFTNSTGSSITGRVTVIVTGHGSAAGGNEYMNTQDTVSLNGTQIGMFGTMVNCASYAQYSPDGNPGIFQNNTTNNPRNWCPGELVPPRSFPATLNTGTNSVSLGITPSTVPSGSYYPTSFSFSSP